MTANQLLTTSSGSQTEVLDDTSSTSSIGSETPIYVQFDNVDEHGHSDNPLHWSTAYVCPAISATLTHAVASALFLLPVSASAS